MLTPRDVANLSEGELRNLCPCWLVRGDLNVVAELRYVIEVLAPQSRQMICGCRDRERPNTQFQTLDNLPCAILASRAGDNDVMALSAMLSYKL